ncbi:MAG: hypothetical protein E7Z87_08675 [Cyanobacteria bacterium SIG26]|nr:hypothetical protein [Cyanobacteria bacterium SIG26]
MRLDNVNSYSPNFNARFSPKAEAYITNAIKEVAQDSFHGKAVAETATLLKKTCESMNPCKVKNEIDLNYDRFFFKGSNSENGYHTSEMLSGKLSENKQAFDIVKTLAETISNLKKVAIREQK